MIPAARAARAGSNHWSASAALIAAGALLCATPAEAQDEASAEELLRPPATVQLTSTTLLRYRGDNYSSDQDLNPDVTFRDFDDDFFSLYQRLDLSLQADRVRVEGRVDAFVPFVDYAFDFGDCPSNIPDDRANCYLDWDIRMERLVVRYEPSYQWTAEVGDTQLVLGRGVALSFRKVDLLGVDNALRGGHVRHQGDVFRFQAHGGLANPQNQDPIDLSIIEEPEDVVLGGSVGARIPGSLGLITTAQAVRIWFEDSEVAVEQDRGVDVFGGTLELPALAQGKVSLYAEGNVMRRTDTLNDQVDERFGRGIYGSAQLQLDKVTLLLEWKDYTDFLVAPSVLEGNPWRVYNAAPAVEYDGPQRLRGIGNQRGGGLRFDYAFLPGPWFFSVNSVFYGFSEEIEQDPFDGILVSHSWLSVIRRPVYNDGVTWSLTADFGGRFEILNHDPAFRPMLQAGDLDRWMIHGRAEGVLGLGDHSFDLTVDHRHERETIGLGEYRDFQIGGTTLTYSYGLPLVITLGLQWTDFQDAIVERREAKDYNIWGGVLYPSIETRWSFSPGTFVSVFVGQTPGGQICSGGICRDVPPYEGVNLQFVARI